ncbi:flagellar hook-length control protein FliK [Peribacillus asahii]|uniref:Flagellar hook-length control protein FliK n=1 Tax=Peribacillus asahii TaxID=228899 RepID=A0A398BAU5_9BACI|nr:flagellar hook-length control protein FliK [Peribacillus asahii]RID87165.1 flagellar hook-length control protein FliK [Peribacillus asahii]
MNSAMFAMLPIVSPSTSTLVASQASTSSEAGKFGAVLDSAMLTEMVEKEPQFEQQQVFSEDQISVIEDVVQFLEIGSLAEVEGGGIVAEELLLNESFTEQNALLQLLLKLNGEDETAVAEFFTSIVQVSVPPKEEENGGLLFTGISTELQSLERQSDSVENQGIYQLFSNNSIERLKEVESSQLELEDFGEVLTDISLDLYTALKQLEALDMKEWSKLDLTGTVNVLYIAKLQELLTGKQDATEDQVGMHKEIKSLLESIAEKLRKGLNKESRRAVTEIALVNDRPLFTSISTEWSKSSQEVLNNSQVAPQESTPMFLNSAVDFSKEVPSNQIELKTITEMLRNLSPDLYEALKQLEALDVKEWKRLDLTDIANVLKLAKLQEVLPVQQGETEDEAMLQSEISNLLESIAEKLQKGVNTDSQKAAVETASASLLENGGPLFRSISNNSQEVFNGQVVVQKRTQTFPRSAVDFSKEVQSSEAKIEVVKEVLDNISPKLYMTLKQLEAFDVKKQLGLDLTDTANELQLVKLQELLTAHQGIKEDANEAMLQKGVNTDLRKAATETSFAPLLENDRPLFTRISTESYNNNSQEVFNDQIAPHERNQTLLNSAVDFSKEILSNEAELEAVKEWSKLDLTSTANELQLAKLQELLTARQGVTEDETILQKEIKNLLEFITGKPQKGLNNKDALKVVTETLVAALLENDRNKSLEVIKQAYARFVISNSDSSEETSSDVTLKTAELNIQSSSLPFQMTKLEQFVLNMGKNDQTVDAEQFVKSFETILSKANFSKANGIQKLFIRLNPEHLGSLRIELIQKEGAMVAKILATTAQAKELLEHQLQSLKQAFTNQNIQVEKIEISQQISTFNSERFAQRDNEANEQRQQQAQQNESEADSETDFTESFAEALLNIEV